MELSKCSNIMLSTGMKKNAYKHKTNVETKTININMIESRCTLTFHL